MRKFSKDPDAISRLSPERYRVRFIHRDDMEAEGYGAYLNQVEDVQ